VEQGLAIVLADKVTALDAATGTVVWTQPKVRARTNSAVCWRAAGATYLLCNTGKDVACLDLNGGAIRWTAAGGGPSTAAVAGNHLAILTSNKDVGLIAYRISPQGAERRWNLPELTDRGASPIIHGGHVYAVASSRTVCVNIETGALAWDGKPGRGDVCSPILADGKLIALLGGRSLALIRAVPETYELLASVRLSAARCASPALAGDKLYVRMKDGLACFDLGTGEP
jgi:hypothetical protein